MVAEILHRPVAELLATISSFELTEWVAYLKRKAERQKQAMKSK